MLFKRIIRTALWRYTPEVASVGVVGKAFLVPGFDGVGRVGEDDVELLFDLVLDFADPTNDDEFFTVSLLLDLFTPFCFKKNY